MASNGFDRDRDKIERLADAWVAIYGKDARWHARQESIDLCDWGDEPGATRLRHVARVIGRRELNSRFDCVMRTWVRVLRSMLGSP